MDVPVDEITLAALAARDGDQAAAAALVRATQSDVWRLCAPSATTARPTT